MIRARLRAERRLKLRLSLALALYFCVGYFSLQAAPLFEIRILALTWVDRAVGFSPGWVWMYQSLYLLIAAVPWLAADRDTLLRYARGFVLLSTLGFVCFLLVPVAAPRPPEIPKQGMFALLVAYDGVLNAFPSLHCGLAAYTILLAARMTHGALAPRTRAALIGALTAWGLLVCYATLATKQHYLVDIPAGVLLAWLSHRWAWRTAAPAALRPVWRPSEVRQA